MATYMKHVMDIYFDVLSTEHKYDKFLLQQYWDETNTLVKNALSSYVSSNYPLMVEEKTHENTCGYEYTKGKKSGQVCGHKVIGPNRKTCYRHTPQLQCIKNQVTVGPKNTVVVVEVVKTPDVKTPDVKSVEVVKTPDVKSVEVVKTPDVKSVESVKTPDVKSVESVAEEKVESESEDEIPKSVEVEEEETVKSLFGDDEPKRCTFVPQKGKFKGTVCGHEVTGDKQHCTKHMKYPVIQ